MFRSSLPVPPRRSLILLAAALLPLAACDETAPPPAGPDAGVTAAGDQAAAAHADHTGPPWDARGQQVPLEAGNPITNLNELFAFIALEEPGGFAGVHVEDDRFVIQMVEPGRARAGAMRWIRHFFGDQLRGMPVEFRRTDRSFADLMSWYRTFQNVVLAHDAIWTDIRESANRLEAGLEPGSDFEAVRTALADAGVPTEVYALVQDRSESLALQTLDDKFRPVVGGVNTNDCTLGFNVRHWDWGQAFVTNAHCTANVGLVDTTAFAQPDGTPFLGIEVVDPPFWTGTHPVTGEECIYWAFNGCRYSDAVLVNYDPEAGVSDSLGYIARPGCVDCEGPGQIVIDDQDPDFTLIDEKRVFAEGQSVGKIGNTTGWTNAEVNQTCIDVDPNNFEDDVDFFPPNTALLCQVDLDDDSGDPLGKPGDSGSPVIADIVDGQARLLGILWAASDGSGKVSRINGVRNDLDPNTSFTCNGLETLPGGGCDGPDGSFDECTGDRESFQCESDGSF